VKKKLTARSVAALKAKAHRVEYWDQILPGFGIRVSTNGSRRYFVKIRVGGKQKRFAIDPSLSLAEARREARRIIADPPVFAASLTLAQAIPLYIARWSKPRRKSWKRIERTLITRFPALADMPVASIKRRDVAEAVARITGPAAANQAQAYLKRCFGWLVDQGHLEHHPCARMQNPAPKGVRDRVLSDDELRRVWRATYSLGPVHGAYFRVLILTAQRRTQTALLRWGDISGGVWTIPSDHAKNGKPHLLPLSRAVIADIDAVPRLDGCPFVFSTGRNLWLVKKKLDEASGVKGWVTHDLRRTAATGMASLGVDPWVVERVLHHTTGVTPLAAVYNRFNELPRMRAALEAWAEHVASITEVIEPLES
jgi:integrase